MSNPIEYSVEQIGDLAHEGRRILTEIEKKAETVSRITLEIREENASKELDTAVQSMRNSLEGMLAGYGMQIRHLEMAAELYAQCAKEVLAEAEEAVKEGRKSQ